MSTTGRARALSQFMRYGLIGGLSTAIHYVVLYTLHQRSSVDGLFQTTIGMLISAAFNFFANYHFTFRSSAGLFESLGRFVVAIGLGVLINAGIFWLLVTRLSWFYLFGQAIATTVVLFWNFLLSRTFVYVSRVPALKAER